MPNLSPRPDVRATVFMSTVATAATLLVTVSAYAQHAAPEQQISVSGPVTVLYADDFAHKRAEVIHALRDDRTGKVYRLRFDHPRAGLKPGARVTVSGRASGSDLFVLADQLAGDATTSTPGTLSTAATTPIVSGDQSTLVIVANFTDTPVSCPVSAVSDTMFTSATGASIDRLYQETSFGQVSFTGNVVGPYTIGYSSTDACDTTAWADAADAAASSANPGSYARKVYVLPPSTCPAAGIGEVATVPSRSWVFACDVRDVYAHELGHNLGMQHASTPASEYADDSDFMGQGENILRQVNAPHKVEMGWLPQGQAQVVSSDGQYSVTALESDPATAGSPQALKIFKSDSGEYYYVSYRASIGFDANLWCCPYPGRLSVHRWLAPADKSWPFDNTYLLAVLADGQTFTDPATGFSVTQVSHTSTTSTAAIQVGAGCGSNRPAMTVAPGTQTAAPGAAASYDVAVTNTDAPACAPTTFSVVTAPPSGWSGVLSSPTLVVPPGATGHLALSVTAPVSTPSGTWTTAISASDSNVAVHSASASAALTIATCVNTPSIAVSPATQSTGPAGTLTYAVGLTNRDASGCPSSSFALSPAVPNGWTAALSSSAVTLQPGGTASIRFSVTSPIAATTGTYGVWTNVADATTATHDTAAVANYVIVSDATPPTAPSSLTASIVRKQVSVAWRASTDNVGIAGYRIFRNGTVVGTTTTSTTWTDPIVVNGATYTVVAFDGAGNISAPSNAATVKTGGGKGK